MVAQLSAAEFRSLPLCRRIKLERERLRRPAMQTGMDKATVNVMALSESVLCTGPYAASQAGRANLWAVGCGSPYRYVGHSVDGGYLVTRIK